MTVSGKSVFAILLTIGCLMAEANTTSKPQFEMPLALRPNMDFWTRIYVQHTSHEVVFFDGDDMRRIYHVAYMPRNGHALLRGESTLAKKKKAIAAALEVLNAQKPKSDAGLSGLTREIYLRLLSVSDDDKYARGSSIRAQNGLRDRFEEGLKLSGLYDREMREYLKQEGLPEELIAIVFVESLFYGQAISSAGAAGLWQLMPGTGREYIHVNRLVDERFDPVLATKAATAYLKSAKKRLKSWPIVVTSYNYGRYGMHKAALAVGSFRFSKIVQEYEHPRFGFAAKNYYAEFLAALKVYKKMDLYFPNLVPEKQWSYELANIKSPVYLSDLFKYTNVDRDWFTNYNPALTAQVHAAKEVLPKGFRVRVPVGMKSKFESDLKKIPQRRRYLASRQIRGRHRTLNENVIQIAKKFDIDFRKLTKRLQYKNARVSPKRGTVIIVRSPDSHFTKLPAPILSSL